MHIGELRMPILVALINGDPLVNVAGVYFPAWLVCMVAGGLATWVLHVLIARSRWPEVLQPAALMVPALFIALTCGTWSLLFAAR
jgi:YtcA family